MSTLKPLANIHPEFPPPPPPPPPSHPLPYHPHIQIGRECIHLIRAEFDNLIRAAEVFDARLNGAASFNWIGPPAFLLLIELWPPVMA